MSVKTDWLDVTYPPDDTPESAVLLVIQAAGAEAKPSSGIDQVWSLNHGTLKIEYRRNYARISASGAFLDGLRAAGLFPDYLSALAESPHAVTRLDAAYDVPVDSPPILRKLIKRYPQEFRFTRKALRTKRLLETRPDGQESGTWYAGHRQKAAVTARVYDKQLERLNVAGEAIPPLTRYELTFRKGIGATLRDAFEPERLFWHYAEPLLLKRPQNVPEWQSGWGGGWHYQREEVPLAGVLKSRIENSAEIASLAELAARGDCLDWAVKLLGRVFRERAQGSSMLAGSEGSDGPGASEAAHRAAAG